MTFGPFLGHFLGPIGSLLGTHWVPGTLLGPFWVPGTLLGPGYLFGYPGTLFVFVLKNVLYAFGND